VLHVIPSLSTKRGGPSTAVQTLGSALATAGLKITIATTNDDGQGTLNVRLGSPSIENGVTVIRFKRSVRFYTISPPLARWLRRNVREFDLVHIHALFSFPSITAARAARRRGVPYIIAPVGTLARWGRTHRHPLMKRVSLFLFERRIMRHASAMQFTSEKEKSEALEIASTRHPVVVPNPVDAPTDGSPEAIFKRFPVLRERRVILFLSRIDQTKGLDILIESLTTVRETFPDVALLIAGSGDAKLERRLRDLSNTLGLDDEILWTGFVTGEDKAAAFSVAEIAVLPSRSESFGIAAVEALAEGIPVVVSNGVAIANHLNASGAALLCEQDPMSLAKSICTLLSDEELRRQLSDNGQKLVRADYSPASVAQQLVALYEECLEDQTHPKKTVT
jgi:glycosyltransferase involved in cell wall biosynthesis